MRKFSLGQLSKGKDILNNFSSPVELGDLIIDIWVSSWHTVMIPEIFKWQLLVFTKKGYQKLKEALAAGESDPDVDPIISITYDIADIKKILRTRDMMIRLLSCGASFHESISKDNPMVKEVLNKLKEDEL